MALTMQRLKLGERLWAAELILRAVGVLVLGFSALIARALCRLVNQSPPHPGNPLEFVVAAAACVCLPVGLALSLEGAGLFRLVPLLPRAWLP